MKTHVFVIPLFSFQGQVNLHTLSENILLYMDIEFGKTAVFMVSGNFPGSFI